MDARLVYTSQAADEGPIKDFSVVSLRAAVRLDSGRCLPVGAKGTTLSAHGGGEAYTVEFLEPTYAVLVLEAEKIDVLTNTHRERSEADADALHGGS